VRPGAGSRLRQAAGIHRHVEEGQPQEALDAAIQAALDSAKGADRMVTWSLKKVSGREGGIAGFNEVTVMIEGTIG
jgi:hypothetical protein